MATRSQCPAPAPSSNAWGPREPAPSQTLKGSGLKGKGLSDRSVENGSNLNDRFNRARNMDLDR